ncbi:MAG: sulfurtransferase TusA family protein [bacterium]
MTDINPHDRLDLTGVACPTNFVKTKLKLEEMKEGSVLELILDDGEPVKNVPRSVKEDGHQILSAQKIDGRWKILIRKV